MSYLMIGTFEQFQEPGHWSVERDLLVSVPIGTYPLFLRIQDTNKNERRKEKILPTANCGDLANLGTKKNDDNGMPLDMINGTITKEPLIIPHDPVTHPKHYTFGKFEVIDVINDWKLGFNMGNAIKYIARADHKNNAIEDLEKAVFYLQDEIKRRKGD